MPKLILDLQFGKYISRSWVCNSQNVYENPGIASLKTSKKIVDLHVAKYVSRFWIYNSQNAEVDPGFGGLKMSKKILDLLTANLILDLQFSTCRIRSCICSYLNV